MTYMYRTHIAIRMCGTGSIIFIYQSSMMIYDTVKYRVVLSVSLHYKCIITAYYDDRHRLEIGASRV